MSCEELTVMGPFLSPVLPMSKTSLTHLNPFSEKLFDTIFLQRKNSFFNFYSNIFCLAILYRLVIFTIVFTHLVYSC